MQKTISAKRKNDAVISVCQNNTAGKLLVEGMNRAAERLTGYRQLELIDRQLTRIFPKHIGESLESDLDYQDIHSDLANILRKIPDFHILNRQGKEIPVSFKIFYMVSQDPSKLKFELLMRDVGLMKKLEELKHHMEGQDTNARFSDTVSERDLMRNLEYIHHFFQEYLLEVSVMVLAVDDLEAVVAKEQLTHEQILEGVSKQLKSTFRTDDIVGTIGYTHLCAILFDCSADDAQKALMRAKNRIESKPVLLPQLQKSVSCKVSMGYMQVLPENMPQDIISRCKKALIRAQEAGGSRICEVVD